MSSAFKGMKQVVLSLQLSKVARRSLCCLTAGAMIWGEFSLGASPAWSQPTAPITCDPATLSPLPSRQQSSGPVDLGSLPGTSAQAADLAKVPALAPPTKDLGVPRTPEAVRVDTIQPITLEQSVELARQRNRSLQIAALQVDQQRFALQQTRSSLYPTVDVQAGITRTDSAQAKIALKQQKSEVQDRIDRLERIPNPTPTQIQTLAALRQQLRVLDNQSTASNNFNGTLALNYDVFTSGQRPASIRAAEAALRSVEQAYNTQLQQLRLDVANDYYDLQQADESVKIGRQAVENAQENLRVTQAKETAGLGTRFEVLQAQVTLANQQQQLIQAQNQQLVAQRQLAQRLSLPPNLTFTAADPVVIAGEWSPTLEDSIVRSLQNRAELAQVFEQRTIAQQNRRVALGSLGPQLGFNASVSVADDLVDSQLGSLGYGLGAQASKLIFDGGAAKAIAAQQEANVAIAETQFADFRNLIRFQVEQNYYTLRSSRDRILTTRCAIEQAQQGLNLARLRRDYGVGTSLEVSNATTDLAQAENNYLSAIVDYNRAFAALQRFVGQ
ncbi:MAG TPA: TolC family protein [Stenomitos sp.]